MTTHDKSPPAPPELPTPKRGEANAAARRERQAAALRENLKKRKSQSRERRAPVSGD